MLIGAIDAYIFAPLQVGLDSLTGRRSLKRSDFLIADRLGEGSFGVVYSGVIAPKNVNTEERLQMRSSSSGRRGRNKSTGLDKKFKQKVILKKVGGHRFSLILAVELCNLSMFQNSENIVFGIELSLGIAVDDNLILFR